MLTFIIIAVVAFLGGYLVGSNNPLPSVKAKIIASAKNAAGKL